MIPFIPWAVYLVADKKGYWEKQGTNKKDARSF
jgi:hypothetical protein